MEDLSQFQPMFDEIQTFLVQSGFKVIGAVVILVIGILIATKTGSFIGRLCETKGLDITLSRFIGSFIRLIIIAFVIAIALDKFGIPITPVVAALGAAALGLSLAVQAPIANYAAGLAIIFTRPFIIGNTITVQGVCGVVDEIRLAYTYLKTEDNQLITIPNKKIIGEVLINTFPYSLVDETIGISYADDPQLAVRVIEKVLANDPDVTDDPKPQVGLDEFAESALKIQYRFWAPTLKLHEIRYRVNLAVYQAIQSQGLSIPFPQRDVHLYPQSPSDPS